MYLKVMKFSIDLMLLVHKASLEQNGFLKKIWIQMALIINILKHLESSYPVLDHYQKIMFKTLYISTRYVKSISGNRSLGRKATMSFNIYIWEISEYFVYKFFPIVCLNWIWFSFRRFDDVFKLVFYWLSNFIFRWNSPPEFSEIIGYGYNQKISRAFIIFWSIILQV